MLAQSLLGRREVKSAQTSSPTFTTGEGIGVCKQLFPCLVPLPSRQKQASSSLFKNVSIKR